MEESGLSVCVSVLHKRIEDVDVDVEVEVEEFSWTIRINTLQDVKTPIPEIQDFLSFVVSAPSGLEFGDENEVSRVDISMFGVCCVCEQSEGRSCF